MKFKYQTFPPECHACGVSDYPEGAAPVDRYSDNDDDPKWGNWLCAPCRARQWLDWYPKPPLHEYLGMTKRVFRAWASGDAAKFFNAWCDD